MFWKQQKFTSLLKYKSKKNNCMESILLISLLIVESIHKHEVLGKGIRKEKILSHGYYILLSNAML